MPELSNDLLFSQKKFAAYQISNAKIINTVFDVITELFAYVIMGQKKCCNYRTPPGH